MLLQIGYIALTLITLAFLLFIGFKSINETSSHPKKDKSILIASLVSWQLFIGITASLDLVKSLEFPPRFAILYIAPSFIFTALFLSKNKNKKWIKAIPEHWIVYFQSFRILVETLFVFSVTKGILHYHVTIEGYNYDMIYGVTALIIAFLVYTKSILPKKVVLYWNYLGLAVLNSVIFLFMSTTYAPFLYGSETPLLPIEALTYPYVLIAGFLMPTAMFLHFLSIVQLKKTNS